MAIKGKRLFLLRHAKSAWDTDALNDFSRPLSTRGRQDVPVIAHYMRQQKYIPERIFSSPALRAWQTVTGICQELHIPAQSIDFDRRLYLADVPALCEILLETSIQIESLMLVGHNPGLDDLLEYLTGDDLPHTKDGKLMTTASLAILNLPDWQNLQSRPAHFIDLVRPKALRDRV